MSKLLDLIELAEHLGRSPETIKKDLKRNPCAVPPRLHIPGTRLLRWRIEDVEQWQEQWVTPIANGSASSCGKGA
jgi:predicted DNA-binding transcriptional regulator AlpA